MASDVAALVAELRSDDPERRTAAAESLARLESEAQSAAVPLVEAVETDDLARDWAVAALEGLGPPAKGDVEKLAELAGRPSVDVAYWAATLLGRLKVDAAEAVPALIAALDEHDDPAVRQRAAWALGQIGPAAGPANESLGKAAAGSDPRLAALANEALGRLAK